MFCGECGVQNPDTHQFCRNCGKPLVRRQPVAQPEAQPVSTTSLSAHLSPAPAAVYQHPVAAAAAVAAPVAVPKRTRNWLGIVSLILGILSWGILTVILAIGAILLGIVGIILFRRATGRIGISSIIGIVFGIAAIVMTIVLV